MSLDPTTVYELNVVTDDPRFEGFAMDPTPSLLGRDSLDDDLTPGFADAEENPRWKQPLLVHRWRPPSVRGRVAAFNDYPGVDMVLPAFSQRAVDVLRDLLEPNGEILSLAAKTETKYYLFNILTISDALDVSASKCEFWCDPPTTATSIDAFAFDSHKLQGLSIFRIFQLPMSVLVTNKFVDRVEVFGLNGFDLTRIWPLEPNVNWRRQAPNEDWQKRRKLNQETLVVNIPFTGKTGESRAIEVFEDSVDARLRPVGLLDEYVGAYEGHDLLDGVHRMFFSCPNADRLFAFLQEEIKAMKWPSGVEVYRRYGRLFDKDAPQRVNMIRGN